MAPPEVGKATVGAAFWLPTRLPGRHQATRRLRAPERRPLVCRVRGGSADQLHPAEPDSVHLEDCENPKVALPVWLDAVLGESWGFPDFLLKEVWNLVRDWEGATDFLVVAEDSVQQESYSVRRKSEETVHWNSADSFQLSREDLNRRNVEDLAGCWRAELGLDCPVLHCLDYQVLQDHSPLANSPDHQKKILLPHLVHLHLDCLDPRELNLLRSRSKERLYHLRRQIIRLHHTIRGREETGLIPSLHHC
jgi:hypothetical protein